MSIQTKTRIASIDLLRGFVMILMALDHIRDYFHYDAFFFDPTNVEVTSAPLFFTRFITHYCAPTFMFLAGTSAFFVGRSISKKELSVWLVKRGFWLIILEFTLVKIGWYFRMDFMLVEQNVIWALGASMIALAGFIHIPIRPLMVICIVGILGHNLLDNLQFEAAWAHNLNAVLHRFSILKNTGAFQVWVYYPLVPWIFVMAMGYCMGSMYSASFDAIRRRKTLLITGLLMTASFFILRMANFYGDPFPWSVQGTTSQTIFSFFFICKYPPSLLYILITLGPALIFLSVSENWSSKFLDKIVVVGRVPMFYYLIHLFVIHTAAALVAAFTGWGFDAMILEGWVTELKRLQGFGYSLGVVYIIWIVMTVLILYPISKWYHDYKFSNRDKWWLSYL